MSTVDNAVGIPDEEDQKVEKEKTINEEYKLWKKNCPFLYDIVIASSLLWPSLTVQWFPDCQKSNAIDSIETFRLLLGTYTNSESSEYLQIATVELPDLDKEPELKTYDTDKKEFGENKSSNINKIKIVQKMYHGFHDEVNRARYMPQNPDILATASKSGKIRIYDRTKHPIAPSEKQVADIVLDYHEAEATSVDWNPHSDKEGYLLSASYDKSILLWSIESALDGKLNPVVQFKTHTSIVNDVQWHVSHSSLFGSVSDDMTLQIHDIRTIPTTNSILSNNDSSAANIKVTTTPPRRTVIAHPDAVNVLAFHPSNEYLLATGSCDSTIGLWDIRKLSEKLYSLEAHGDAITTLRWSPHDETILASGSNDRRIIIWDISCIGNEQTPDDAEDGPPEVLFMHGGHKGMISDLSWNPKYPWTIASADSLNMLQVWKIADTIIASEDNDIPNDLE